jgi:hypothetical protein
MVDVFISANSANMQKAEQNSGDRESTRRSWGAVDAAEEQRFNAACPHGRLVHGEGLEKAMGPTVYPYFKHFLWSQKVAALSLLIIIVRK